MTNTIEFEVALKRAGLTKTETAYSRHSREELRRMWQSQR